MQDFTRSNNSFRISVQSINGISQQPNSLTVPILGLVFVLFLILFNKFINFSSEIFLQRVVRIIYPSIYLLLIIIYRLIFNFENLIGQNGLSFKGIINDALPESTWGVLILINITVIISPIIAKFIDAKLIEKYDFIGFLLPILLFVTHQMISLLTHELYSNGTSHRYETLFRLVLFASCIFMYFLAAKKISQNNNIKIKNLIPLIIFVLTFIVLFLRIPSFVYSYRPTFNPIVVEEPRILIFVLLFSLVFGLIVLGIIRFNGNYLLSLGGLFYIFSTPFEKLIVPNLDSYHYGEYIGLWFNTKIQNLQPYTEIEYPRGLFVNFLPAAVGNFLSPGNPELQNFWLIILGYLSGFGMVFLLSYWMPTKFALLSVLLLPVPNNYVEIDYVAFSFILASLLLLKKSYFLVGSSFILLSIPLLILAFPGQGVISSFLMCIILFNYRLKVIQSIKGSLRLYIFIYTLIAICYVFVFSMLLSAIKWVFRNSVANAQFFSDGWVNKFLFSENFPISLRWFMLALLPLLILFYIIYEKELQLDEKILLMVGVFYLILISGRWFGRTDFEILSRVGIGGLAFVLLIIIPLFWKTLYPKNTMSLVVVFSIVFALATPFKSINLNFISMDRVEASVIGFKQNSDYNEYGENLLDLKNKLNYFFGNNPKVINLTGGSASDYYMKIPSVGGIQSPYMIINDDQENEWLSRLQQNDVNGFYGPYGSFGGIKADGTTIGGRAPKVLKWLMDEFNVIKCDNVYMGIKNAVDLRQSALECSTPKTAQEKLDYWDVINGSSSNLGNSLTMWARGDGNREQTAILQNLKTQKIISKVIRFTCLDNFTDQELKIAGKNKDGEYISTIFYANLSTGISEISSEIFPINNLVEGDLNLIIENKACTAL